MSRSQKSMGVGREFFILLLRKEKIMLQLILVMIATLNNKDHYQIVLAHDFSITNESFLVTLVEQRALYWKII